MSSQQPAGDYPPNYPFIYGFKTPEKYCFTMTDGDYNFTVNTDMNVPSVCITETSPSLDVKDIKSLADLVPKNQVCTWDFNTVLGDTIREKYESKYVTVVEVKNVCTRDLSQKNWITNDPKEADQWESTKRGYRYEIDYCTCDKGEFNYANNMTDDFLAEKCRECDKEIEGTRVPPWTTEGNYDNYGCYTTNTTMTQFMGYPGWKKPQEKEEKKVEEKKPKYRNHWLQKIEEKKAPKESDWTLDL